MEMKINNNVCREYWIKSCMSANLSPGVVINAFSIFSTALVNARRWKENGDEKARKIAMTIMSTAFPGKLRKGDYTPLPRGLEEDGNIHHYIINDVVKAKFEEMAQMELTPENIIQACIDLQAVARMYAEQTIDAAKTGLMIVVANIEYLQKLKAASKLKAEIVLDWDKQKAKIEKEKLPVNSKKKVVTDIFEEFRMEGFDIAVKVAQYFAGIKQTMPEEVLRYGAQLAGNPVNRNALAQLRRVKNYYATLNQIQRFTIRQQTEGMTGDKEFVSQTKKAIKPAFDTQFATLTKTLRSETSHLNAIDRACLALHVTYEKTRDENVSRFAQDLLAQELMLLILHLHEGDESVPQYTEDALIRCNGYEEGDIADFVFGEAEDEGKLAVAREATLEGEYIIRKNKNGKFVASRKLSDIFAPAAGDSSEVVFVTKMTLGYNPTTVAALEKALVKGADVQLVPYHAKLDLHDAVLINGVQVANFQCDNGPKADKMVNKYFRDFYSIKGKLKSAVYGMTRDEKNNKVCLQAVVTLTKCERTKKVDNYVGKALIADAVNSKLREERAARKAARMAKQAEAAAKADSSYRNCEDALPGLGAPAKKKVAPKKVASTLPGLAKTPVKKTVVKAPVVKKSVAKAAPKKGRVKPAAGKADAILI